MLPMRISIAIELREKLRLNCSFLFGYSISVKCSRLRRFVDVMTPDAYYTHGNHLFRTNTHALYKVAFSNRTREKIVMQYKTQRW